MLHEVDPVERAVIEKQFGARLQRVNEELVLRSAVKTHAKALKRFRTAEHKVKLLRAASKAMAVHKPAPVFVPAGPVPVATFDEDSSSSEDMAFFSAPASTVSHLPFAALHSEALITSPCC